MMDRDSDAELAPTEPTTPPFAELPSTDHGEHRQTGTPDDAGEPDSRSRLKWYIQAAIPIFLATIVLTMLMPTITNFVNAFRSKPVAPAVKPSTTLPSGKSPPAPTAAVQMPAVAGLRPDFSTYDERFLLLMTQAGRGCPNNSSAEQCKVQMVDFAHQICSHSGQPVYVINQNLVPPAFFDPRDTHVAIAKAEQAYPECTLTGNP